VSATFDEELADGGFAGCDCAGESDDERAGKWNWSRGSFCHAKTCNIGGLQENLS
jgi:hypothetical protein